MDEVLFEHQGQRIVIDSMLDKDSINTVIPRELATYIGLEKDQPIEIMIINGHVLFDQHVVIGDFPEGFENTPPIIGIEHLKQSGLLRA